jgi:hypothetical protein
MSKRRKALRKVRAARRGRKRDWHFSHVVQDATAAQMDHIWDAFIDAVEHEGLYCGGGLHPLGQCSDCKEFL